MRKSVKTMLAVLHMFAIAASLTLPSFAAGGTAVQREQRTSTGFKAAEVPEVDTDAMIAEFEAAAEVLDTAPRAAIAYVSTSDELLAAIADETVSIIFISQDITILGAGGQVINRSIFFYSSSPAGEVTITNLTLYVRNADADVILTFDHITIQNGVIDSTVDHLMIQGAKFIDINDPIRIEGSKTSFLNLTIYNCSIDRAEYGGIYARYANVTALNSLFSDIEISAIMVLDAEHVTVRNCEFKDIFGPYGGALDMVGVAALQATNCVFENNSAEAGGGAATLSDTTAVFENCNFLNNKSVISGAISLANASVHLVGGSLIGNEADEQYETYPVGDLYGYGGAIGSNYNYGGTHENYVIIEDMIIKDNYAMENGGVVGFLPGTKGKVEIRSSQINGNTANNGGAFYIPQEMELVIEGDSTMAFNSAEENGGAIYSDGAITINDGTISDNEAFYGGAIYTTADSTATMNGGLIEYNSAYAGGGMYTLGKATIAGGEISNNLVSTNGGGIYGTQVALTGGRISDNTARNGAGVYYTGVFTMINGTITGNSATQYGGGIYGAASSIATLFGGSIISNTARIDGNDVYSLGIVA